MVDFGGWEMPVQYSSILAEHRAVRERAGLFDVSHMGEIAVTGPRAEAFVDHLITNRASALAVGQVLYSLMCDPSGGVVDDLLCYRLGPESFLLVVNAANTAKDLAWVMAEAQAFGDGVDVADRSAATAQLALQGPLAQAALAELTDVDLNTIKAFWFRDDVRLAGRPALVSRTGYTGEDGFEIYLAPEDAVPVWRAILEAGRGHGVVPCGLGARDSLRFEARLPLYGQEIGPDVNPLEAGLGLFVKLDKPDFIGKEAIARAKAEGIRRKLVGFEMIGRGIPRHGYEIVHAGKVVGHVSSGMYSPTLDRNVGLGFVPVELAHEGQEIAVRIRGNDVPARIVPTPFYRRKAT